MPEPPLRGPAASSFSEHLGLRDVEVGAHRAARVDDTVTAVATPLHVGRTTLVVQAVTTRGDGKEVSATTQTQLFLQWS